MSDLNSDRVERFKKGFNRQPVRQWIEHMIGKLGGEGNVRQGPQEPIQEEEPMKLTPLMPMPEKPAPVEEYDETEAKAAWDRTDKGMKRLFNFDYNEFLEFYKTHRGSGDNGGGVSLLE